MSAPENESAAFTDPPPDPVAAPTAAAVPEPAAAPEAAAVSAPAQAQAPAARRLPRAVGVALATAGLLAVTAASAAVTVAVGKPDSRPAAAPAPRTTATASPSTGAGASASTTPSAVPVPTVVPTAPAPVSTVKGTVSDGKHEGDLRYFLLPIPAGGESYGPADGMPMTRDDVAEIFGKSDDIDTILTHYGYRDGATRTYRTADGKAEVTVTLLHFGSADMASRFVQGYTIKSQEPIDIDGDPNAHGFRRKPKHEAYTGSMTGISSQGDVQYTIDVDVKGTPDKALLNDLMKRQREWLASGG
ncbi:hypothetical protein [Kitasatospora cathayae]|uniref:Serine/arginine repetitive matrix protein 2 n=1 Tax=Kitasatospora cathayae TaxID=3004092 RepID=A0ABY7QEC5_9ACTN|nr:hypothetical protein [Kitasatospora sp. HUAS 3-15]WBP91081.1 hypothetical protein O1G21_37895 [Kitasatospora sp. HUAS 3-15]